MSSGPSRVIPDGTKLRSGIRSGANPTKVPEWVKSASAPYALTVSIFGGTAPAIALFFKQQGREQRFYYYLSAVTFISPLVYSTMRDTKHETAMDRHE